MPESKVRKSAAEKRKRTGRSAEQSEKKTGTRSSAASRSDTRKTARAVAAGERSRAGLPARKPWLLPVSVLVALLGIAWGVFYFVDDSLVPYMQGLGRWNIAIGVAVVLIAAILYLSQRPRSSSPQAPGNRRWVPPAFIATGLIGVAWLIVYYVAGTSLPFMSPLGNWNILIGMGGMAASFVIATLWK